MRALHCALALLLASAAQAAAPLRVVVRAEAVVEGERVVFADVGEVTGEDAALAARVRALDLGPAPSPSLPRTISRELLEIRLRQERLGGQAVEWAGAQRTRLRRKTRRVAGVTIAQVAAERVRKILPWPDEDVVIEVQRAPADVVVLGTTHDLSYTVSVRPGQRLLGNVPVRVSVRRGSRVLAGSGLLLRVRVFQALVVARRRIERGERLTKDHVRLQRMELTGAMQGALTTLGEALGQEARRSIPAFAVLSRRMVGPARVVRRGSRVTLLAEAAGLRVTTAGVAVEDGAVGRTIGVQNLDSRKVVYGKVVDGSTVRVRF